ncbi:transmembrane protein 62 [Procambarus clarkii]|uniref:transmembrane protein 62 n=1 Tax=Procambarus clarkii TaxID=6728 RepID=UPI001E670283|nr:transmembrane protein 62-like isoform X1 [Procambarus clarkii]XP_045625748.1 transmembrane protein 62-like isoform X1 [Procambarus clarkii]XP_045625749.1 transmembrane protein 62-like isoform X1 [Procambarus clarkii]XP_045625750.1 transmembrane protein 62-like isoform X1 [Procambarus clarkii]
MRIGLGTIVWTILALGGASLVGQVVRVLSIDVTEPPNNTHRTKNRRTESGNVVLDSSSNHLIWFMQISDLHLSVFQDVTRATQFREFSLVTVAAIKPAVVLASGDLTDAKTADRLGSRQFVEEWTTYSEILRTTGVLNKTVWLDIRGNHDNFNVPSLASEENYYQKYSVQGQHHPRSYMYTYTRGSDSVAFIGVDACLLPGPKRPFNFIGMVTASEMRMLEEFEMASMHYNHTIWFGHYPTSCILSPDPGIRRLMGRGLAYLCGHLHTLGGLVPNMYTRQHTGSLELELGDWKDGRVFRVAAIDHGLFSFTDVKHGTWPIILVTNPKHALYAMKHHEPLHLIQESTYIRVLLWSLSPIAVARVRVDDSSFWLTLSHVEGPLFVAKWNPDRYTVGLHMLKVFARDSSGQETTLVQPFSLDDSQPSFHFWPRALLMSNISMFFQFLFGIMVCICVVPLCVLRYIHHLVLERRMFRPRPRWKIFNTWLRKLWVLVSVDRLFWPLVITAIYLPLGPWFVGEVIEDHIGVVFAWGTFVNRSYLPGSLTYAYGFFQLLCFHFPLTLAVAHCIDFRFWSLYIDPLCSFPRYLCRHVCLLFLVTIQMITAYFFWLAYGTMAFVLGPLRTWSAILGMVLWHQSSTMHKDLLRGAAEIWIPHCGDWENDDITKTYESPENVAQSNL